MIFHDHVSSISHAFFCKCCAEFGLLNESTVHYNDPVLDPLQAIMRDRAKRATKTSEERAAVLQQRRERQASETEEQREASL